MQISQAFGIRFLQPGRADYLIDRRTVNGEGRRAFEIIYALGSICL